MTHPFKTLAIEAANSEFAKATEAYQIACAAYSKANAACVSRDEARATVAKAERTYFNAMAACNEAENMA